MRKMLSVWWIATGCLLAIILSGCTGKSEIAEKGDFSFESPKGYSITNVTDESCTITCDETHTAVGRIELTQLKKRDLNGKNTTKIMTYLQEEIHKTNNVEFAAFVGGSERPYVSINLTRIDDDAGKEYFYHVFFEKESCVYNMWFNKNAITSEQIDQIVDCVIVN